MSLLEYIHGRNFQSHKDTYIEFHPGINCLIGDNKSGKTSIIRMLIAVMLNPRGLFKHCKRWQKHWPHIEMGWNGHVIERHSKGYILDGKHYDAVGGIVPEDIAEILNIRRTNFKLIRDPLFLIGSTPGDRAKMINTATGLDAAEELVKICSVEISGLTSEINTLEKTKTSLKRRISVLSPLEKLEPLIERLDKSQDFIIKAEDTIEFCEDILNNIKSVKEVLSVKDEVMKMKTKVTSLTTMSNHIRTSEEEIKLCDVFLKRIKDAKEILKYSQEIKEMKNKLIKLKAIEAGIKTRQLIVDGLERILEQMAQTVLVRKRRKEELSEALKEKEELLKELGVCPYCGSITGGKDENTVCH